VVPLRASDETGLEQLECVSQSLHLDPDVMDRLDVGETLGDRGCREGGLDLRAQERPHLIAGVDSGGDPRNDHEIADLIEVTVEPVPIDRLEDRARPGACPVLPSADPLEHMLDAGLAYGIGGRESQGFERLGADVPFAQGPEPAGDSPQRASRTTAQLVGQPRCEQVEDRAEPPGGDARGMDHVRVMGLGPQGPGLDDSGAVTIQRRPQVSSDRPRGLLGVDPRVRPGWLGALVRSTGPRRGARHHLDLGRVRSPVRAEGRADGIREVDQSSGRGRRSVEQGRRDSEGEGPGDAHGSPDARGW
jgi:hypothetical protein